MKKILSISLIFLILLTGTHLTIAKHYCGGSFAASKVSFTGELASCGMENSEESCPQSANNLKSHCCDDEVTVCTFNNTYTLTYSDFSGISQVLTHDFALPVAVKIYQSLSLNLIIASISPPHNIQPTAVNLAEVCVFRN